MVSKRTAFRCSAKYIVVRRLLENSCTEVKRLVRQLGVQGLSRALDHLACNPSCVRGPFVRYRVSVRAQGKDAMRVNASKPDYRDECGRGLRKSRRIE